MSKVHYSVSGLPFNRLAKMKDFEWFDLNNYERARYFTAVDWEHHLRLRMWPKPKHNNSDGHIAHLVNQFKTNPLDDKCGFWIVPSSESSVNELIIMPHQQGVSSTDTGLTGSHKFPSVDIATQRAISQRSLTINIDATDKQIEKDFADWLKKLRAEQLGGNVKNSFTNTVYERWIKYNVLAYLDLMIVAEVERKELTQDMAGELLFPHEYNITLADRIKDTVVKWAKNATSPRTLKALAAQIAAENK